jgi:ADP-heptose:LPS heptosyltransferase/predicted SAM-dependent methyltransferase
VTWTAETSQGFESDKICHLIVPYVQGRALDIGCGQRTAWPSMIGIDNGHHFGAASAGMSGNGKDLSMFSDGSMDAVFSSHFLEHVERAEVPTVLKEWARVLKIGGHLALYLPSGNLYPRIGQPGANPDHKWDPMPGDVEDILKAENFGCGWELVESEERSGTNEYSLFIVARKTESGWTENVWQRHPDGKKRALVVRYGAIGDQVVASSILPGLQKRGYHVTYNTTPDAHEIIKHDPHVDAFLIQGKDFVPNQQLGPYWDSLKERYDLIINLCESIEGALLTLPGRLTHAYPDATRRKLYGTVNYLERTHDLAGVPYDFAPKFYATKDEEQWARDTVSAMGGGAPVIMWAIHGSANHKVYPWVNVVVAWLLERSPCHIVLTGDGGVGKELQDAIVQTLKEDGADMSRVHAMAGVWKIREAMAFSQVVDCVVGPETGTLNGVCFEDVPKVLYLSHSSHENLTKRWKNTTVLEPDRAKASCWPCHRLHYDWSHCHQDTDTQAALCASSIAPERVFKAIAEAVTGSLRLAAD